MSLHIVKLLRTKPVRLCQPVALSNILEQIPTGWPDLRNNVAIYCDETLRAFGRTQQQQQQQ